MEQSFTNVFLIIICAFSSKKMFITQKLESAILGTIRKSCSRCGVPNHLTDTAVRFPVVSFWTAWLHSWAIMGTVSLRFLNQFRKKTVPCTHGKQQRICLVAEFVELSSQYMLRLFISRNHLNWSSGGNHNFLIRMQLRFSTNQSRCSLLNPCMKRLHCR